ncbi:hypothetical protein PCYB_122360 [Plasmodium cynomolgi strain B]|uniref:Uncharacterized protein n=1 Tax=Plasmodium cynomolgi (strain B) TaxID=1120755 RepID=K6UVS6_PLACD|nr:hypothetical protein PCYB_122360 [Plasmodium cynomolgi strain B]GAB67669.1 hypothetical protein PCYB_122360 [Plasmodium cynomolgi strain B]
MNRAIHKRKPGWVLFSRFKSDIKTVPKRSEDEHYEMIRTVIRQEKKVKFKNIFLGVSLINVTTFLFTLSNYYTKRKENHYDINDIEVVDHIVLSEFVSSMGLNNLPVYLQNKFFHKLVKSVQDENYSFKENALLGLLELFYKNKSAFIKIEKENKEEHEEFIKYIFAKLEEDASLEYTKKKIYSCILFYYIKHSDHNLSLSYEHIQEISYFDKINSPFCIDNNSVCVQKKNSYNSIMNKIYLKYFENTVIYTFFFSFVLHNINAKEYTLMNYLFASKDILRSVCSNCLINAMLLVQKAVTQNLSMRGDERSCVIAAFLFNQLNSLAFSASLYKCKYALVPLLFSQIVKDNFFL